MVPVARQAQVVTVTENCPEAADLRITRPPESRQTGLFCSRSLCGVRC